ncbi:MAG: MarR family transcriptional regulator [Hamadaea sp.]|nr:MarR family transcriptional regulator [Hamadaea sp.]
MVSDKELAGSLIQLATAVHAAFTELSRAHGLAPQQAVLACLLDEGPVGMCGLGEALKVEKSSLSGLVDRAEKRGLVRRLPDPEDRRAVLVALTDEGRATAGAFKEEIVRVLVKQADELPAEIAAQFRASLPAAAASYWAGLTS